jgi:hypothetical protein
MLDWFLLFAVAHFVMGIHYLLHLQKKREMKKEDKKAADLVAPISFVPVEDIVVPSRASYSFKFNDTIGNYNSGLMQPAKADVVVPSDWYMSSTLPTEFDGPYWPNGGGNPDFLYPGSDPKRPLRNQNWPSWFSVSKGA